MNAPESPSDPVVVGVISAPHGVRGTVRVKPTGEGRHLREGLSPVLRGEPRRILASRRTPKGFLVDFEGFGDRDAVESLRGEELTLDRSELDPPPEGEVYVADLPGLEVLDADSGERLGRVAETFETAAHEVLVVRGESASELYLPFTQEHVPEVDLLAGRILARPPEPDEG